MKEMRRILDTIKTINKIRIEERNQQRRSRNFHVLISLLPKINLPSILLILLIPSKIMRS
jgi:hypothetical protein